MHKFTLNVCCTTSLFPVYSSLLLYFYLASSLMHACMHELGVLWLLLL